MFAKGIKILWTVLFALVFTWVLIGWIYGVLNVEIAAGPFHYILGIAGVICALARNDELQVVDTAINPGAKWLGRAGYVLWPTVIASQVFGEPLGVVALACWGAAQVGLYLYCQGLNRGYTEGGRIGYRQGVTGHFESVTFEFRD